MSNFKAGDPVLHTITGMSGTVMGVSGNAGVVMWEGGGIRSVPFTYLTKRLTLDWKPDETRSTSSSGAEKGVKPETFSLIPVEALEQVARHYGVGAKKYAPHNWRAGYEWSKSYDALQRHANAFWRGEDTDQETGSPHMAAVAFHALTLLTFMQEHPQYDDRYKPGSRVTRSSRSTHTGNTRNTR